VQQTATALQKGAPQQAIEQAEAYADTGEVHPDLSYNRGLAYLARVHRGNGQPGDLGRAAAAFEETLLLRENDSEAQQALTITRKEVAHGRARGGMAVDLERSSGGLATLVELGSENVWMLLGAVGSVLLTLGLLLRRVRQRIVHVAGDVACVLGLVGITLFLPLAAYARYLHKHSHIGVMIAPEARWLDEHGNIKPQLPAVPEASRVHLVTRRGGLWFARWAGYEGYVAVGSVKEIRAGSSAQN